VANRYKKRGVHKTIEFGDALAAGTRLTPLSEDKPDRFFTVIEFWMDETSEIGL
jgi:hypothetical protein